MHAPLPDFPNAAGPSHPRLRRGFAIAEVLLILLIAALAVALLCTLLGRAAKQAGRERFVTQLQDLSTAFENYRKSGEQWPPTQEITRAILERSAPKTSPFGGAYAWSPPDQAEGTAGAIALTAFAPGFPLTLSASDLRAIDGLIDDGALGTGRFRTGFNGWPVYRIGDPP